MLLTRHIFNFPKGQLIVYDRDNNGQCFNVNVNYYIFIWLMLISLVSVTITQIYIYIYIETESQLGAVFSFKILNC